MALRGDPTFANCTSLSNFSVSTNGVLAYWGGSVTNHQLVWFDRAGKQLGVINPQAEVNDVVLSPDEKRAAVQRVETSGSDIWLIDLARGVPSRFTFEMLEDDPAWSPDGTQLIFSAQRGGPFGIYRKISSGSGHEELLFKSDLQKEVTDCSSDGKFVLFDQYTATGGLDVWVLPLFGDRKPFPLLQSNFHEGQAHFSPDGHWFAYVSDESGRSEVYVQSFPLSGGQWQISSGGGAEPHWRKGVRNFFILARTER